MVPASTPYCQEDRLTSTRKLKVLFVVAVAAMAMSAVSVSSASASLVLGKFSSTTWNVTTSGVTIKRGTEAKSCGLKNPISAFGGSSSFLASNDWAGTRFTCTDLSSLVMSYRGQPFYDTVSSQYFLRIPGSNESAQSPWGPNTYFQSQSDWTWVNGSGATPTTLTLNELVVGTATNGEKITITGTLTVKNSSGGLITLSH
jgi:hypothetical protein